MIDVRRPRPIARILSLALAAVLASATACRDGDQAADGAAAAQPAAAPRAMMASAGEVVIPKSSQAYVAKAVAAPGSIGGTVTLGAPLAALPPVPTGADSALCGPAMADGSVTQRGNGLGGVVVWLEGVRRGRPFPLERRLELESDKCVLAPRVQAAVVGSAVNVLGHDAFRQHLHFISAGERDPRASVLLGHDEQVIPTERPFTAPGMVIVRDADHSWPTAYLAVFDHPYFAVTAPDGSFVIDGVPAGRYRLVAWHERTKKVEQEVEVSAGVRATVGVAVEGR